MCEVKCLVFLLVSKGEGQKDLNALFYVISNISAIYIHNYIFDQHDSSLGLNRMDFFWTSTNV